LRLLTSQEANALVLSPIVLAEARRERGWTQEELAAVVGCSLNTVKAWEAGRRSPDPVHQVRLTKALRLNPNPQPVSAA
jgi:DNA-binding transcriptional regulator YiaG